jgi:hypothetical protein
VAEQELALSVMSNDPLTADPSPQSDKPAFFAYFVPPQINSKQNILRILREKRPCFIFGEPGMGKTTLRLTLEAECRRKPNSTLVVSYLPGENLTYLPTQETHWLQLAKALAIDLFIQIIERFNPLAPAPTTEQVNALRQQIQVGGRALTRLTRFIVEDPEPKHRFGLGKYWERVGRSAVRHVARPQELVQLLQAILRTPTSSFPRLSGKELLQAGIETAQLWGFEHIFILIDGVDNQEINVTDMQSLLSPLMDQLWEWQAQNVVLKLFLPLNLYGFIEKSISQGKNSLPVVPFKAIIRWSQAELRELLVARFRAAQSRRLSFEDLAGDDLVENLDELILQAAHHSPRRLITIVNALINAHIARNPDDLFITADDWKQTQANLVDKTATPSPVLSRTPFPIGSQ